jgi:hypothetical protein
VGAKQRKDDLLTKHTQDDVSLIFFNLELSDEQLAGKLGIPAKSVARMRTGRRLPTAAKEAG